MPSITPGHHDKPFNGSGLDGVDDLVRQGKNLAVGKAACNFAGLDLLRGLAGFGQGNHLRKIFGSTGGSVCNMPGPGIIDNTGRKQSGQISIFLLDGNQAVGGQKNGAVKCFKILILVPPRRTIIAHEMTVFLKRRVIVGGQHFTMRVYIHTASFRLLEQLVHVFQIVPGN